MRLDTLPPVLCVHVQPSAGFTLASCTVLLHTCTFYTCIMETLSLIHAVAHQESKCRYTTIPMLQHFNILPSLVYSTFVPKMTVHDPQTPWRARDNCYIPLDWNGSLQQAGRWQQTLYCLHSLKQGQDEMVSFKWYPGIYERHKARQESPLSNIIILHFEIYLQSTLVSVATVLQQEPFLLFYQRETGVCS